MAADRVRLMKGVDRNYALSLAHAGQLDSAYLCFQFGLCRLT